LLHPAAGHGVRRVSSSRSAFRLSATRRSFRSFSRQQVPFEAFPSPAAEPCVTADPSCEGRVHRTVCLLAVRASLRNCVTTARHSLVDLKALFHRRVRVGREAFPLHAARCSHGLWIDTFRCLPRTWRRAGSLPVAPGGSNSARGSPFPERDEEGKDSRLCLALRGPMLLSTRRSTARRSGSLAARRLLRYRSRPIDVPEGNRPRSVIVAPVRPEGPTSAAPRPDPEGSGVGASRKTPRGSSTVPVRFTRRCSVPGESLRSPKRRCDPVHSPEGLALVVRARHLFRSCPKALPFCTGNRSPPTDMPEGMVIGAPLAPASRRTLRRAHRRDPRRNRIARANPVHPKVGERFMAPALSSKLEWPASGQIDIASSKQPVPKSSRRPEGRRADAEASGARLCPRSPPEGGAPSRGTEVSHAETSRSPSQAPRAEARGAFVPVTPKCSWNPRPV